MVSSTVAHSLGLFSSQWPAEGLGGALGSVWLTTPLPAVAMLGDSFGVLAEAAAPSTADGSAAPQSLFSLGGLMTLGMLILLQAVLGFDNLLYISIESERVEESKQSMVRRWGIALAIGFRILLLFVVVNLLALLREPLLNFVSYPLELHLSGHSLIVLGGGGFILWTAIQEIYHLLAIHDLETEPHGHSTTNAVGKAVGLIVAMNVVFSFDSILSAMALTESVAIMATAIVLSGVLTIVLADRVAAFLKKNRMDEVLGLFILFDVGVMLVSEGGHLSEAQLFGYHVNAMEKSTFYFVLPVLIVVERHPEPLPESPVGQTARDAGSPPCHGLPPAS
jgi:predicted tellurium resistance membrane protein TerC